TKLTDHEGVCPWCGLRAPTRERISADRRPPPASAPELGWILADRYRIDALLHRGIVAEAFRGTDLQSGDAVVIKLLAGRFLGDTSVVQRFLREAKALASLDHPRIIAAPFAGEHHGHPLIVMRYVEGPTVAELLHKAGALPLRKALEIAAE